MNFDGEVEPGWDEPLRALLEDPGVAVATGLLVRPDGATLEAAGLDIAPNTATYGRIEGAPRAAAPAAPLDVVAASGALMMVRREDFLALGGFLEPLWMYGEEADYCLRAPSTAASSCTPGARSAMRSGMPRGPISPPIRLYWPSRNRLINAARHLPGPALARSVAASAAFDALTLAQIRAGWALGTLARGWRDGLRLMPAARRERTPASARERRAGSSRCGPRSPSSAGSAGPASRPGGRSAP